MVDHVLDEEAILATFDSLVARGVIYFSSDETSTIVDDNFHVRQTSIPAIST